MAKKKRPDPKPPRSAKNNPGILPNGYAELLGQLKDRIRTSQLRAAIAVNCEMIELYWHIGRVVSERQQTEGWGKAVIDHLGDDLQKAFPGMSGFSRTNIYRMRAFYLAYRDAGQIVPRPVGQFTEAGLPLPVLEIPWGHNVVLVEQVKDLAERLWYARKAIESGWSRNVLVHCIDSDLYRRQGKAQTNFERTLPSLQSDLARETLKDPYAFEFLTIADDAAEKELERGLSTWTQSLYNSSMLRIHLDDATRERLRDLRRKPLPPKARDRIEMITLADASWSAPRIAAHLGHCGQTIRDLLKDFLARGTDALHPRRTGPAPDVARRDRVAEELRRSLAEDRTWTSGQLSEALAGCGIELGPRQVRRYLKGMKAGYRRTASTLKHKQDPAKVQRAGKVLANLKAKAAAGSIVLYYLDECGFSPTLPVGYSWSLPGLRKFIRYEAPQGRRVNALAAYRPFGSRPRLDVFTAERTWNSYDLIGFLKALPWSKVPRVVVLDNASIHTSKVVRSARKELAGLDIYLYFLPPYSPELNRIEPVFRQVKYQEIPVRSHATRSGLREAVEAGFNNYGRKLRPKSQRKLRPAA